MVKKNFQHNLVAYILIGILISVMALIIYNKVLFSSGKARLSFNIVNTKNHIIDFTLSNSEGGIAYVDKIEVDTSNFFKLTKCTNYSSLHTPIEIYAFDPLFLDISPKTYELDTFRESDAISAKIVGSIKKGLKYRLGDLDKFRIFFSLDTDWFNPVEDSYSYNLKINVYWCD